jgi:hypothetical protein
MSTLKLKSLQQGQAYAFRYPNFADGTDYRRVLLEGISFKDNRVIIEGVDLDHGNDGRWSLDRMQRIEPVHVELIPKRAYSCKWGNREVVLYVWTCYPNEAGGFRITGKARGEFVSMDLAELSEIEAVESRKAVCNG